MVDSQQLQRLLASVEKWNQWRHENHTTDICLSGADLSGADLSGADLSGADLSGTDLSGATLRGVDFRQANLKGSKFKNSSLHTVHFSKANLSKAELQDTQLTDVDFIDAELTGAKLFKSISVRVRFNRACLRGGDLSHAILTDANFSYSDLYQVCLEKTTLHNAIFCSSSLIDANLTDADLRGTNLSDTDCDGAKFVNSNLTGANLTRTKLLGANCTRANLTGACLQDWHINNFTYLEETKAEYIFRKSSLKADTGQPEYSERCPRQGTFQPGEFAVLIQQTVDTVDLIFKDGIDWQAFFQSFQNLRSQYADQDLSIQAIEKKSGGAFIVRLEVTEGADKAAIESSAKELYENRLKALEAYYERHLRLQGEQHLEEIQRLIEVERQEKATLMGVLTTMANNQGPKYNLSNAQFAGGFAETVQGDQIGGNINNQSAETPSLAEAAAEIQQLLKQLEASNPTATEAEQTTFLNVMIPPTRRERFVGALKSGSIAAIDEIPYGPVLKALVEGWQKPNG